MTGPPHGAGSRCARGSSVLTPLVAVLTAALMAVIAQFALLAPHARIATTLESIQTLGLPLPADDAPHPYGACGDICSVDHRCRHVVLRDGLHDGSRVSRDILMAAQSCH